MGVDYKAIFFVGKYFESFEEAEQYFIEKLELDEEQAKDLYRIDHWLEDKASEEPENNYPEAELLDKYGSDGPICVGYNVFNSNANDMVEKIMVAKDQWSKLFNDEADIINEVVVY